MCKDFDIFLQTKHNLKYKNNIKIVNFNRFTFLYNCWLIVWKAVSSASTAYNYESQDKCCNNNVRCGLQLHSFSGAGVCHQLQTINRHDSDHILLDCCRSVFQLIVNQTIRWYVGKMIAQFSASLGSSWTLWVTLLLLVVPFSRLVLSRQHQSARPTTVVVCNGGVGRTVLFQLWLQFHNGCILSPTDCSKLCHYSECGTTFTFKMAQIADWFYDTFFGLLNADW